MAVCRRTTRFLGRAFLLLTLGVASTRAALDLWVDHRLEAITASLEKEGLPTCPQQLAPEPLPPDENAAPLFTAAYAVGVELHAFFSVDDFYEGLDPEEKAKLDALLARNERVFELIRLARPLKGCQFNRDLSCNHLQVAVKEAMDLQSACAALGYKARREAEQGRHPAARETVRDMLVLADAYRDEPLSYAQVLRRNILEQAARTVAWSSRLSTSSDDLAAWLEVVPDPRTLDGSAAWGMRGDLASCACRLTQPNPVTALLGDGWEIATLGRFLGPVYRSASIPSFEQYVKTVRRCSSGLLTPDIPELSRGVAFDLGTIGASPPSYALQHQKIVQAILAVSRAGLEAEISFVAEGRWPERLEGTDPFTGEPLSYDRIEGTISSAGPLNHPPELLEEDGLIWRLRER